MGPCPPDRPCYSRTICDTTLYCLDNCNPDTEYNREYLFASCTTIDWDCATPNTTMFMNECGCGCEQDPTCPEIFYCTRPPMAAPEAEAPEAEPRPGTGGSGSGATPPPYCDPAELERCPFTPTAF
jgi:hypothetical protein